MIRDALALDHFYVGFSKEQFRDAKLLTNHLSNCNYHKVQSGKMSWRGFYMRSNFDAYFEILETQKLFSFGIACSAWRRTYIDGRRITKEMPELPWSKGRQLWKDTGKTWFDLLTLKRPEGIDTEAFYSWIMHYHQVDDSTRDTIPPQASVERFQRLTVRIGEAHIPSLKFHAQWLPGTKKFAKKHAEFVLPNRDGSLMSFDIEFIPGNSLAQFVQLEASACADVKSKSFRSGSLNLKADSKALVLSAKK